MKSVNKTLLVNRGRFMFISLLLISAMACSNNDLNPVYIDCKIQNSYPSGSTISYLEGLFYIMGDDASEILVLNELLEEKERVQIFPKGVSIRTPKLMKADIEASLTTKHKGRESILFLGSGSLTPHRDSAFLFDPQNKGFERIDFSKFYDGLRTNFQQLNIEAATMIGGDFVLGIRGNATYPDNYIVFASSDIFSPEFKRKVLVRLPVEHTGISGMDYDQQHDNLFITFSSESTPNAFDDGEIGESYLAIITEAKEKLQNTELTITTLTKLTGLSPDFKDQKIESVSLINGKRELLLVADDDMGNTMLFRLGF